MDRLGSMAVFVKVVEASSFAAAARHFRMSPAMASKHVQALEERIGARLLNRTTRRVNPTEVGQSYYERCLHILADFEEAEREAGDANVRPRGLLKISAPFTFGIAYVGPALADYLATYPDVSAELVLNDRSMDLLENGFDVAIRVGHLPDSSLIGRRLITAQTVLCASPHYLDRFGVPRTLQDLASRNCLVHSLSKPRDTWRFVGRDGEPATVQVSGRFIANNGGMLRMLALKGEGIICVPSFIVGADLAEGLLVRLLDDYEPVETPVSAVYPHGRFLSAKVRAFVDLLAAQLTRTLSDRPNIDSESWQAAPKLRVLK